MASLDEQLQETLRREEDLRKRIDERNAKRRIECASCDGAHPIRRLVAIQTHWYVEPHGCTGGDYWREGELQYICPETGVINRLLFNNDDVPWGERRDFANDPEAQFKRNYRRLFKEVRDSHGPLSEPWVNNFYVDRHRKEFGLVEKRR
ncbi:hypothetical protein D6789_04810 [Candidatus Woesearchaeota archaeon]|nr:MAG: hypothetical protein D6789_04810 [Candidatus Woesearchaeota archaeon]